MIKRLRIQLTLWFFFLVMFAYLLAGFASFWSMKAQLSASTENHLLNMCEEIVPAVDYVEGKPSLSKWMQIAALRHTTTDTTIQLYDRQKRLIESYGPKGVERLEQGRIRGVINNHQIAVYSQHMSLPENCFVQVQLPTKTYDQAIAAFLVNEVLRAIPLSFLLAIFGWFYAGRAVAPVARSLKTLRNFVDDAGHELNTPIALIENSIETVEVYLRDNNLSTDVLKIIQRASKTLKNLSQNLLLLAKMEEPSIALRREPVNLAQLVRDLGQDFSETAAEKDIELQVHDIPEATVFADSNALVEVISNLLDNAIRYTQAGGQIYVYGFRSENTITIAVRDTGCGIAPESLPRVFDRFYRADKARSKKDGGNGLGLAIVKAIVKAHGGNVRVESVVGNGSTFFVALQLYDSRQIKLAENKSEQNKFAKLKDAQTS